MMGLISYVEYTSYLIAFNFSSLAGLQAYFHLHLMKVGHVFSKSSCMSVDMVYNDIHKALEIGSSLKV